MATQMMIGSTNFIVYQSKTIRLANRSVKGKELSFWVFADVNGFFCLKFSRRCLQAWRVLGSRWQKRKMLFCQCTDKVTAAEKLQIFSYKFPDLWKDARKRSLKKINPDVRTAWEKYWPRRVTSLNIRQLVFKSKTRHFVVFRNEMCGDDRHVRCH